ncbi:MULTISPECIES: hypothetical protein [unclassified Microcoleus]|uniref:hypothetical protein n=1 Tax=unclassified Microcoleus TaxID=2642155 RepID=UPI002FD40FAE
MSVRCPSEEGRRKKEVRQRIRSTNVTDVTDVSPMSVGRRKKEDFSHPPLSPSPTLPLFPSPPLRLFPSSHPPLFLNN